MTTQHVAIRPHLIFVTATVSAVFVLFAQSLTQFLSTYWTDSEIWAVASSRMLFHSSGQFDFGMKPLFHLLLWLSSIIPLPLSTADYQSLAPALDGARVLMGVNALFLAFTLFWVGRKIFSPSVGIVALLLLLLNPTFLQNISAVRSDILAIPWIFWSYYFLHSRKRPFAALCFLAACLITPKAGLFIIPFLAISKMWLIPLPSKKEWRWIGVVAVVILGLALWQRHSLQLALEHFLNESKTEQMGMSYWAKPRWIYMIEAMNQTGWFWLSLIILIPMGLKMHASRRTPIYYFLLFSAFSFLILLLNPSKLPFLIASYLPIFTFGISALLVSSLKNFTVKPWMAYSFVFVISIAVGLFYQQREVREFHTQNIDQRERMNELSVYFTNAQKQNASLRFYDGLGLLTDRQLSPYFIGPGQLETNQKFPQFLETEDFALLIETQKVQLLKNLIPAGYYETRIQDAFGISRKAVKIQTDASGKISAQAILNALRTAFSTSLNSESRIYLASATGETLAAPWPEAVKDWGGDESIVYSFPNAGSYFVTLLPPFESASRLSFSQIFRFRRNSTHASGPTGPNPTQ